MSRLLKSTLFSFLFLYFLYAPVHAQIVPGISDSVTFVVTPEYPAPRQTVYIGTRSFIIDLDKAVFKWTVNGKILREGVGVKEVSIESGAPGTLTSVSVEIQTRDFGVIKNSFSFRPAEVTLLWQSDTYTPPFYKGKALHAYNGSYKVVAIPEFIDSKGARVNPKNLIYTWKKNGETQGDASGFGRDYFVSSQISYLRDRDDISVEVSSPKESMAGSASTSVTPAAPELVLYEDSPLYGIVYEKAVAGSMELEDEEVSLRAEPFNVSASPFSGLVSFDWFLNGSPVRDFKDKNSITLRTSGETGRSEVAVRIQHLSRILQGGREGLTIFQR